MISLYSLLFHCVFFKLWKWWHLLIVFWISVMRSYDISMEWVCTYPAVPAGLVDTCVSISGFAFDMPKSATLAIILPSSRMLLGFTSLWITGGSWIHNGIVHHLPHISHIHTWIKYIFQGYIFSSVQFQFYVNTTQIIYIGIRVQLDI